jgi:hypothetical protein
MFRVSDLEEYETQKVLSEFVDSANEALKSMSYDHDVDLPHDIQPQQVMSALYDAGYFT